VPDGVRRYRQRPGMQHLRSADVRHRARPVRQPITGKLLAWYRRGHRDLPWRRAPLKEDPYAIWISEIMLQQTRVETVKPYFTRWMARFPTVNALAEAPLDDVLTLWAGLGYYARARNLHAAAREIAVKYQGRFPDERDQVHALPGIGRYTAGAILSIAFGKVEPILDGNVSRVLSRVFFVEDPGKRDEKLWALAEQLVPQDSPGDFNQALMELGATVCVPRAPSCLACPLRNDCAAQQKGLQEQLPAKKKKAPLRTIDQVTVLVERQGRLLLLKRPPSGLWGGLWEPPTGELAAGEEPSEAAARVVQALTSLRLGSVEPLGRFEHVLTHRRMQFHPFRAIARGRLKLQGYQDSRWLLPSAAGEVGVAAWAARLIGDA
jgi:A/G-specific adenine glycosylase